MRKVSTKEDMAKKKNTRVVYCNTPEASVMLELASNADILYKHIRKNAGYQFEMEKGIELQKRFLRLAMNIEMFLGQVAEELNMTNYKKSNLLENVIKLEEK
ncbi:MAG: hypothetical protein IE909_15180 [Campylobacterales bacterium]|nr:hypothetical protein [Campylobacterales bacterium]